MSKIKTETVEQKIVNHLKENGQMLKWLSDGIGCSVSHLHSVLKGKKQVKRSLTANNLEKINAMLKTDFKL